jgi:branched-chain amino acid transport system ATP-binding protein
MLLEVKNLTVDYGMVRALTDTAFHVDDGEIVAMIGPNGAGKSTALKAVSGILDATGGTIVSGEILFEGKSIKGMRTDQLVGLGISLVPEGRHVFPTMTVRENLEMGAYIIKAKSIVNENIDLVFELFPHLKERVKQKAGTLSSGEQQMLALGRALMLKPKLLLVDEPSVGLSPNYVEIVFEKLKEINKSGTSILLVEQNALKALEVAWRAYVFSIGEIEMDDESTNLLKNDGIKKTFLGG